MDIFDKTICFAQSTGEMVSSLVTIFDGSETPRTINLNEYRKQYIYFGRDTRNDIVITSKLVSAEHGRFVYRDNTWVIEDKLMYRNTGSTNGLIYNNTVVVSHQIAEGDFIRIDDGVETISEGVLFVFSAGDSEDKWHTLPLTGQTELTIGRDNNCSLVLPHVSISKCHARITREQNGYYITDNDSTNGVVVNNKPISGKVKLHEKDVIVITNSKLIFTSRVIFYCCYKNGVSVDAADIVVKRGTRRKSFVTCNHVNLNIKPGELVAVIGGSGAGKSTILNVLCGYLKPTQGDVCINGVNLYQNFDVLKNLIGYVPQSDIVYDNLTLCDMLKFTAKLRLPEDTSPYERKIAIEKAIETVELTEKKDSYIKSFSGGQRKRASIAVELLSEPNLLFLDEPASGLDPGTERNLMRSLRAMADGGKTVILVTHSTLQLQMCDKIAFMGKGGNLCFLGSYDEALKFFEVADVVDIYNMITDNPNYWHTKYEQTQMARKQNDRETPVTNATKKNRLRQCKVLCSRYIKLVINDRQRLLLILMQAPLLAGLIALVADGMEFKQYEMTKSLLFALSCAAFWVGMLNSIQEICKECSIAKREYMTGLSLGAYIMSKMVILGLLCLIQSVLIVGVFVICVGMPEQGVLLSPLLELLITTFLTSTAATATGLFVSAMFKNADRAMTVAPILLMPQILFSGLIFELGGITKSISWLAICRWSVEGYGTIANLNTLPLKLQQEGIQIPRESEEFFTYGGKHLVQSWGILIIYMVVLLTLSRAVLTRMRKEH